MNEYILTLVLTVHTGTIFFLFKEKNIDSTVPNKQLQIRQYRYNIGETTIEMRNTIEMQTNIVKQLTAK